MKLYYTPGACSLAPHILLREAGLDFELERVDLASKKTASGADFLAINPKGYVPALQLDSGELLTEIPALMLWIGDHATGTALVPPAKSPGLMSGSVIFQNISQAEAPSMEAAS